MRLSRTLVGLIAIAGAAMTLTLGALAAEPLVTGEREYPFGSLDDFRGAAFEVDSVGPPVDLHDVASRARREFPDTVVLVLDGFDGDKRILVVGNDWNLDRLERWRDAARLPLLGPSPIALGMSAPDFFSAPRRNHDLVVASAGLGLVAAAVLAINAVRHHRRSAAPTACK